MRRNGNPAYPSWIGLVLISMIVAGWMFFRADAANPPVRSAVSTPALVSDVRVTIPDATHPTAAAPNGHAAEIKESNVAPADLSSDEGAVSNSAVRAALPVASVDGVTLLRQSLRRGGLGSKALMTLTIRNSNDYPVNNIELLCTFRNRGDRYVTQRHHVIDGMVKPNSRRTFRHMMVGFVSINANRARCSLLSADWA